MLFNKWSTVDCYVHYTPLLLLVHMIYSPIIYICYLYIFHLGIEATVICIYLLSFVVHWKFKMCALKILDKPIFLIVSTTARELKL